jgi:hypothetical protein
MSILTAIYYGENKTEYLQHLIGEGLAFILASREDSERVELKSKMTEALTELGIGIENEQDQNFIFINKLLTQLGFSLEKEWLLNQAKESGNFFFQIKIHLEPIFEELEIALKKEKKLRDPELLMGLFIERIRHINDIRTQLGYWTPEKEHTLQLEGPPKLIEGRVHKSSVER